MRAPLDQTKTLNLDIDAESAKSFLERYQRCSFCNTKLMFSHDLNLSHLQVVETSRCPGCGVTMHPKRFTLH